MVRQMSRATRRGILLFAIFSGVGALVACNLVLGNLQDAASDGGDSATSTGSSSGSEGGGSSSTGSSSGSTSSGDGSSSGSTSSGGDAGVESGLDSGGDALDRGGDAGVESGADSGIVPMQSCAPEGPGMTNCGNGGDSCCASPAVPGGTYDRTYNIPDETTSGPPDGGWPDLADPATLTNFSLDKYLVTVGRFRQFVKAVVAPDGNINWFPPAGSGKHTYLNGGQGLVNGPLDGGPPDGAPQYETGWDAFWSSTAYFAPTDANLSSCASNETTWTSSAGGNENLPINCVTWFEAYAFCIWDGGFLPSEAEWEFAAAGGSQERLYPWGSAQLGMPCPGTGCEYAIQACNYPDGSGNCFGGNIAPVGFADAGAGLYGQLDMAGNLWEWILDWYQSSYISPCKDCADLTPFPLDAGQRGLRGGAYFALPGSLLSSHRASGANRSPLDPTTRSDNNGIRCARAP